MPLHALKASWEVFAGILPGEPMPEYTKRWYYTSEDYQQDCKNADDGKPYNQFSEKMREAIEYSKQAMNPARVNWVRVDFLWL